MTTFIRGKHHCVPIKIMLIICANTNRPVCTTVGINSVTLMTGVHLFGNLKMLCFLHFFWYLSSQVQSKTGKRGKIWRNRSKIRAERIPYLLVGWEAGHYVVKWHGSRADSTSIPPLPTILVINLSPLNSLPSFFFLTVQSPRGGPLSLFHPVSPHSLYLSSLILFSSIWRLHL